MNKKKILLINNWISNFLVYSCFIVIPLEFIRINFKFSTVSLTSVVLLLNTIVLSFIYKDLLICKAKESSVIIKIFIVFLVAVFWAYLVTLNLHALGIIIEWFFLPIISSFVLSVILTTKSFSKTGFENAFLIVALVVLVIASFNILKLDFTYDGRLKSFWHSPNYLAMIIEGLIPVLIWNIYTLEASVKRFLNTVVLIGMFTILFATQSIFGVMSVFFGLIFFVPLFKNFYKKNAKVFLSLFLLLIIGISFLFYVRGDVFLKNMERSSIASRINIWNVSKDLIINKPLIGYGFGTFQKNYLQRQKFYKPYLEWAVPSTHNTYLMLWFSGGFFMLFAFMFVFVYSILKGIQNFLILKNKKYIVFLASILTISIHGFMDTTVFGITISYIFWFLIFEVIMYKNK